MYKNQDAQNSCEMLYMFRTMLVHHQEQLYKLYIDIYQTQFIRGRVRELKNAHNSVTVQNRTHVYMNFLIIKPWKSPPAIMP